jgi:hypothetical protein
MQLSLPLGQVRERERMKEREGERETDKEREGERERQIKREGGER